MPGMIVDRLKIPRDLDRRVKLTYADKIEIQKQYNNGLKIHQIARNFASKCCRRTIQFVLFPERLEKAHLNHDSHKYYDKVKWRKTMAEHRAYKKSIINKLIKK